ncbi:hypothetical protein QR98_0091200, partial [Sarcoptes scabiei]
GTGGVAAGAPATQIGDGTGLADGDYVPVDRGVFPDVDDQDPTSVLVAGLEVSFGWDPARDSTQFDGFRRARSLWNNQYLRDGELGLSTLVPMSSRAWQAWGDAGTRIVPRVDVLSDQHPPDTETDFHRVVAIDQTELTAGGGTSDEVVTTLVATVRVHKTPLGWRLEAINVIDNIVGGSHATQTRHPVEHDHEHSHGRDDHVHIDPVAEDPAVAATSALTVLFSWDPARQSGPGEVSAGVAEQLFTGGVAADVRSGGAVIDRPEQWGDWVTAHARVSALVPQTRVMDTGDERSRVVAAQVEQTLMYPDGGHSRLPDRQV